MQVGWRLLGAGLLALAALGCIGCRGSLVRGDECPGDPDAEIVKLRDEWTRAPYNGIHDDHGCGANIESKELLRRKAENLLYRYPRHVPTRFFAALLAYEASDPIRATEHLDTLFALQPVHPEAAVLRAQIALEDGNYVFATSFLQDQVALSPDSPELYEALASAHFVAGRSEDALRALATAQGLGAREWRVAYNRGLIEESLGQTDQAIASYQRALELMPSWPPAKARLNGLTKGFPQAQTVAYPPANGR